MTGEPVVRQRPQRVAANRSAPPVYAGAALAGNLTMTVIDCPDGPATDELLSLAPTDLAVECLLRYDGEDAHVPLERFTAEGRRHLRLLYDAVRRAGELGESSPGD